MISIAVVEGDQSHLYAPALMLTDAESVEVDGHPGIAGTPQRVQPSSGGRGPVEGAFVSWMPKPGELVRVTSYGISRAELVIYDSSKPEGDELKTIPIPLGDQEGARTVHISRIEQLLRNRSELRAHPKDPKRKHLSTQRKDEARERVQKVHRLQLVVQGDDIGLKRNDEAGQKHVEERR